MLQTFFRKAHSLNKTGLHRRKHARKSKGQSMVEMAIALPLIILLFSGLVEFGFMLNYYLSLLDATREAARYWSNGEPFNADLSDKMSFYPPVIALAKQSLEPQSTLGHPDSTRKITLDPAKDDLIVVVFDVNGATVTRHPLSGDYRLYGNIQSGIKNSDITSHLVAGAPNTAILLVEVYYNYHQVLGLAPFANPILLHAYTMMPMPPTVLSREPNCNPAHPDLVGCNIGVNFNDLTLLAFINPEVAGETLK